VKEIDAISGHVIDVALRIHKELGPGLLETVYEIVLAHKLVQMRHVSPRLRVNQAQVGR
jgi:iron complex transport system substrate-binding protein